MGWLKYCSGAQYGRYDKVVHFFASAALTVVLVSVVPVWAAAAGALGVGGLKELYDWTSRRGRFDVDDVAADAVGVVLVAGLWFSLGGVV